MNAERQLLVQREKVNIAVSGLKKVIAAAVNHSQDWNPEIDRIASTIIIEAENALRDIDGCKQAESVTGHWLHGAQDLWQLSKRQLPRLKRLSKVWYMFAVQVQSSQAFQLLQRIVN